jgi:hypothetical protein
MSLKVTKDREKKIHRVDLRKSLRPVVSDTEGFDPEPSVTPTSTPLHPQILPRPTKPKETVEDCLWLQVMIVWHANDLDKP